MREQFSRIGFILAVSGGAIGLGNMWKFPTVVAKNGGSAFVILFLLIALTLGIAGFLGELVLGRLTRKDLANAYFDLAKKHKNIHKMGGIFMLGGVFVLSFYLVILGWVLRYVFVPLSSLPQDLPESVEMFTNATSGDFGIGFLCFSVCAILTLYIVGKGVKEGIEKLNVYIMPLLSVLLVVMFVISCFSGGFKDAFVFLFKPDFSKITFSVFLDALGLGLFTLCLGVGCISAYAASLDDKTDILKSALLIVFLDLITGLLMGQIIFSFAFDLRVDIGDGGAGLVFVSLLGQFGKLGILGNVIVFLLFLSLFFAGITSAVSMIEPFAFYVESEFKIKRKYAMVYIGIIVFILGTLAMASMQKGFSINLFNKNFFDFLDFLTSNIMLPLGVLFTCVFIGFASDRQRIKNYMVGVLGKNGYLVWFYFIKFVCPIIIVAIMVNEFYPLDKIFGY